MKRIDNNRIPKGFEIAGVYIIKNRKNGKFYIGSSQNVEERITAHKFALRHGNHPNKLLQADYDAGHRFYYDLLYHQLVPKMEGWKLKKILKEKEDYYIRELNALENGYNMFNVNESPNSPESKLRHKIKYGIK